jgi:hypothetical protein
MVRFIVQMALCTLLGFLARRKGYNFFIWFFAGVIGLVVLAFLPFATTDVQKRSGNWIGFAAVMASILVLIALGLWSRNR